jgi:predicted enzyme related to lactoylglutathione lyase
MQTVSNAIAVKDAVTWFEIPVTNMDRAVRFYEAILARSLRREVFGGIETAIFPYAQQEGVGGSLVRNPQLSPGSTGTLVYLNCQGQLDEVIGRVAAAGGAVVLPKTDIGDPGFISVIEDTEGNRVGLHTER